MNVLAIIIGPVSAIGSSIVTFLLTAWLKEREYNRKEIEGLVNKRREVYDEIFKKIGDINSFVFINFERIFDSDSGEIRPYNVPKGKQIKLKELEQKVIQYHNAMTHWLSRKFDSALREYVKALHGNILKGKYPSDDKKYVRLTEIAQNDLKIVEIDKKR